MKRLAVFACWLVCAHGAGVLAAAPVQQSLSPEEWLEAMGRAFVERDYDGVFSYFDGDDLSTLRLVHAVLDGTEHERLVHLDGDRREFVRRGDDIVCILDPNDEILALDATIPAGPFARAFTRTLQETVAQYAVTLEGRGRIAGRDAVRVLVAARDGDRYAYRLWIDEATALLLRSDILAGDGSPLEIFQFATIRIDEPIEPHALESEFRRGSVTRGLTDPAAALTMPSLAPLDWRPDWLPDGFTMASSDLRHAGAPPRSLATQMYSDGLAALSVFIEEAPVAGTAAVVSRNGATVAVTHLTEGPQGAPYLVTVVGEVPTTTAERVARSIRFASGG
jgi:sigma-E factor negative regulatory protein RseB